LAATLLSAFYAKRWLDRNGIRFPWALLNVALASIGLAAAAILLMVWFHEAVIVILGIALIANGFIVYAFYRRLPALAVAKVQGMLRTGRAKS
jgi:Na+/melibiose symporter-like transporter